jgi:undecaprenyl-phosphate 4-deoxy-4-formamido-L-arabinose transferase
MKVSVVIPCYRSRAMLPELVERLHKVLDSGADGLVDDYELILVVDGSPDDTYAIARELELASAKVRAVLLRRNYGQHNALLAGIARAQFEVTVTMDDDLQHRPEELPRLLEPLRDPLVDLVYGVAIEEEHGIMRSFASRTVKSALAWAGVHNARDVSALRAFRTDLREGFSHIADAFASVDVVLSWTTSGVRRVHLAMDHRGAGRSSYSLPRLFRHAITMVTGYSTVPLRFVTWLGIACGLVGLGLLGYVLYAFISGSTTVAGFTMLASMIALFSGAQMVSLGILGEYIGRMHFRGMQRPTYLVRVDGREDGPRAGISFGARPPVSVHEDPDSVAAELRHRD